MAKGPRREKGGKARRRREKEAQTARLRVEQGSRAAAARGERVTENLRPLTVSESEEKKRLLSQPMPSQPISALSPPPPLLLLLICNAVAILFFSFFFSHSFIRSFTSFHPLHPLIAYFSLIHPLAHSLTHAFTHSFSLAPVILDCHCAERHLDLVTLPFPLPSVGSLALHAREPASFCKPTMFFSISAFLSF